MLLRSREVWAGAVRLLWVGKLITYHRFVEGCATVDLSGLNGGVKWSELKVFMARRSHEGFG